MDVQKHSVHTLVFRSLKRSHDFFISHHDILPPPDAEAMRLMKAVKLKDQYSAVLDQVKKQKLADQHENVLAITDGDAEVQAIEGPGGPNNNMSLTTFNQGPGGQSGNQGANATSNALANRRAPAMPKPAWHPPWKLYRVIAGHHGWVRCISVDPTNQWFATGSNDRLIKIWDLASGICKLSLTGHISAVRGLAVSDRHPYLFSAGEDKQVKCWDLEHNKVIRHYHGHLSACYTLAIHPTIDVLVTAGRDATVRVWDMRTKANVHVLTGHTNTVASVVCQAAEPQILSGSHDSTVRLWDLAAGKSICTLTNHKKSVRSVVVHPTQYMFASASADNIKEWKCPEGKFIQNLSGHNGIVNAMAVNPDGVLVSGADNGSMNFWDWRTGFNFQKHQSAVQPGSLDSEAGIFAMAYDQSGTRLITGEADKSIKLYKEDDTATEESHPINWKPDILKKRRLKSCIAIASSMTLAAILILHQRRSRGNHGLFCSLFCCLFLFFLIFTLNSMAFLCPVRIRRSKKKKDEKDMPRARVLGRITGSASVETLVRVGLEKEHGLAPDSKMIVLHDFMPCVDDELEVKRGSIVNVLYQENDWVYVIAENGKEGFIPQSYCAPFTSQVGDLAFTVKKKLPRDLAASEVGGGGGSDLDPGSLGGIEPDGLKGLIPSIPGSPTSHGSGVNLVGPNPTGPFTMDTMKQALPMGNQVYQPDTHPFFKERSGRFVVLYTFLARDENDVSVERGELVTILNREDPDWFWILRDNGQEGFVPSAFVYPADALQAQMVHSQMPAAPVSQVQVPHQMNPQQQDDPRCNGTELIMLYDYKAQASDDLSLRRGDWVYADLSNQTMDGWLWAYSPKLRKSGFIPKAYARPPAMTSL